MRREVKFFGAGRWLAGWGEGGGMALVLAGAGLAWVAGVAKVALSAGAWGGWEWLGALGWAAVAVAWGWGLLRVERRWGGRWFAVAAAVSLLAVELLLGWASAGMSRWPMDAGVFRLFLDRLAEGGYSAATLGGLTGYYDYGAWCHRALPFLYPLRLWSGAHFGAAVQVYQSVLGAVTVLAAWRTGVLLFGERSAKWGTVALTVMPGLWTQGIGLNHQVPAACWFMLMMWGCAEWVWGGGGWRRRVALAAMGVALGAVMRFAGSVWALYAAGAAAGLVCAALAGGGRRQVWRAVGALVCLVLLPHVLGNALAKPALERIREANPESINGGSLAYMARGWDPTWGGEFSATCERLDVLTPREAKDGFFRGYLAGQLAYNGRHWVARLLPEKAAKCLLAGYASLAEEVWRANVAEDGARCLGGMRTGYFLVYAPLLLLGLWRLLGRRSLDGRVAMAVLPCAVLLAAVVLTGETSPRYSLHVQPLLAMVLGTWLAGRREKASEGKKVGGKGHRWLGLGTVAAGGGMLALAVWAGRSVFEKSALWDMREAAVEGRTSEVSGTLRAFEVWLADGAGAVTWPGRGGAAAAYLWSDGAKGAGRAEVSDDIGGVREVELPARVELRWGDGAERRLEVRRTDGAGAVMMGYADGSLRGE